MRGKNFSNGRKVGTYTRVLFLYFILLWFVNLEHGNEERADTNIAHEQIMDPEVNGAEDMYTHDGKQ